MTKCTEQIVNADCGLDARVRKISARVNSVGDPRVFTCAHRNLLSITRQNVGDIEIYMLDFMIDAEIYFVATVYVKALGVFRVMTLCQACSF